MKFTAIHKKQIRPLARLHGYWIYRRFLAATATWTRERRRAWVAERLRRTLSLAAEGVPFYRERFREAGFDPVRHFKTVEDLRHVPLLTKDDVRRHHERMIDARFERGSVTANTSGTTGQPLTMRLNESYIALDYACMYRHWAQAGYRFRARYAALRSFVPKSPGDPLWKFNWPENTLYLSAYHLRPANANAYLDALIRFQPEYLRGYPSALAVLAELAWPRREALASVRGVFTASETLSEWERASIERTFGRKLFDWYGMTEPAVVATERATHDGLEVNWEYGFPEFLEGDGLETDQRRLVATSLHNPVMPFIRYDTGDLATLAEEPDAAGLYPKIRRMAGRKDECILTPDGGRLPSLNFYSLLQTQADLLRFQFLQTAADRVLLKLSVRPGTRAVDRLVAEVREEVVRRLGPSLTLVIEVTDELWRGPDGKTPTFKRLCQPPPAVASVPALDPV